MSPRGPIDVDPDDLAPQTLAKVRARVRSTPATSGTVVNGVKVGSQSPLLAAQRARSRRAQVKAGSSLEDELKLVHELYELRGRATIERAYLPTKVIHTDPKKGPLRVATGTAAVDFYGTANVGGKSRSIYFDVKSNDRATYAHEPKQRHQLTELLKRRQFGALTFLLVIDRTLGVGFLLAGEDDLNALLRGRELTLREPIYHGEGTGKREKGERLNHRFLYPHFFAPEGIEAGTMERQDVPRWDWLSRLETLTREGK